MEYCKRTGVVPEPKPVTKKTKGPNQTEAAFKRWFCARYPDCRLLFESIKLRIDSSCWYTPDYFCPELSVVLEIKGAHIFEDSVIKFKAARAIHPYFHFEMWQLENGVWREIRKLSD